MNKVKSTFALAAATLGLAAAQPPSIGGKYNFVVIDHLNALYTFPLGINDSRTITGFYIDQNGVNHGFIWKNGGFQKTIDHPKAAQSAGGGTVTGGINNHGDLAGTYFGTDGFQHGFRYSMAGECEQEDGNRCKPVFTEVDVPGAAQTSGVAFEFGMGLGTDGIGINNRGDMTGMYATNGMYSNAFILSNGRYRTIDSPTASHLPGDGTKCFAINDDGAAACDSISQSSSAALQLTHGFLLDGDRKISIEVPGSEAGGFGTQVNGINNAKKIVGTFTLPSGALAGLVWFRGDYFTLNYPGMPFTELHSINNSGAITGAYATDTSGQFEHGFVAIPK